MSAVTWEDRLVALAVEAPDLPGPELARRAGQLVDMTRPGADRAFGDLVEAVQILRDLDGFPLCADQVSDEPQLAGAEWESHRDDALRRLSPAGSA